MNDHQKPVATASESRLFVIGMSVSSLVLTWISVYRFGLPISIAVWATIGLIVVASILFCKPKWVLPIYRIWSRFSRAIGLCVTILLLVIVFVFVITPIGLVIRLLGQDPLSRSQDSDKSSYWKDRGKQMDKQRFLKQY